MSSALCPRVVSQAPQQFRPSEKQATCDGCFSRQSICSVTCLHSGMSRMKWKFREFLKYSKTITCDILTLREYTFQEAERQFFCSVNVFVSQVGWTLLSETFPNCVFLGTGNIRSGPHWHRRVKSAHMHAPCDKRTDVKPVLLKFCSSTICTFCCLCLPTVP